MTVMPGLWGSPLIGALQPSREALMTGTEALAARSCFSAFLFLREGPSQ
jgi:hypothetical protein